MKITVMADIKRMPDVKEIALDDGRTFLLSIDTVITYDLRNDKEINENELLEIVSDSNYRTGLNYAINYLTRGSKTIKEVRDKLKLKGIDHQAIARIIERLKELDYLDDEKYAIDYIDAYSSSRGKIRLKNELYIKGVDKSIIDESLNHVNNEEINAEQIARKAFKGKLNEQKERDRIIRLLISRGYSYDIIKAVIKKLGGQSDDLSDI